MNMKDFERVLITEEQIKEKVAEIGKKINKDYGDNPILLICVLKGSAPFATDLMRQLEMDVALDFMIASSYGSGATSSGHLTITKDVTLDLTGRDIIVVEDIVDTGFTLSKIKTMLLGRGAKSVKIAAMLSKPSRRTVDIDVDYIGFEIPDEFVIGYGLDYDERYRNLPFIGILSRSVYEK